MENIGIKIDDAKLYQEIIKAIDSLKDGGDLQIITKNGAMNSGRAGAMLTFTVDVGGQLYRAQTVVPMRLLKTALKILDGAYDDDGMPRARA